MFDLITGDVKHAPHHTGGPLFISMVAHTAVVFAVFLSTILFIVAPIPQAEMISAFVAAPPPPPPPPPPAPPPPEAPRVEEPVPTAGQAAPVEEPKAIAPEPPPVPREVFAGVEGGVPGGVVGGLLPEAPLPPPPPPPPPPPRAPVRIGGQIKEPKLVTRVAPEYPLLGLASQIEGVVILEAVVDEEGKVESLRVLRSAGIFDAPALEAVKQWRYSPVVLNGRPEKFILTVVVSFKLQ